MQFIVGVYYEEGPPVPIPNTVVKLFSAENTWREAARENRSTLTSLNLVHYVRGFIWLFVKCWGKAKIKTNDRTVKGKLAFDCFFALSGGKHK